eukprot:3227157-Amphidinium_carterae.1
MVPSRSCATARWAVGISVEISKPWQLLTLHHRSTHCLHNTSRRRLIEEDTTSIASRLAFPLIYTIAKHKLIPMAEAILAAMSQKAKAKNQPRSTAASGDGDMQATLRLLTRLTLSHEGSISSLTATSCLQVAIVSEEWKQELSGIKTTYKEKGWGESPPADGPCLRAACHAAIL